MRIFHLAALVYFIWIALRIALDPESATAWHLAAWVIVAAGIALIVRWRRHREL